MNQKQIGVVLIIAGILLASTVYIIKKNEDKFIEGVVLDMNSCYLSDGTCLHSDRDYTAYMFGWSISIALVLLGIYLSVFDKTQKILAEHQSLVVSALEKASHESRIKDEFSAYLAGFSDDEQKILKAIKEQDGILQSTLRYRVGMSKTAVSLILKSLEERKIVSRSESGKSKKIFLQKKF